MTSLFSIIKTLTVEQSFFKPNQFLSSLMREDRFQIKIKVALLSGKSEKVNRQIHG